MGLETVLAEIREKGQREVQRLRSESQQETTRVLSAAQERAGKIKQVASDEADKQTGYILSQEISAANLLVKRELLNTQKELLDQVYQKALISISGLPESFHGDAITRLLFEAKTQIPEGIVRVNRRDRKILEQVISGNPEFKVFSVGADADIEGGVIVESRDGTLQLDLSYRTFLDMIWESGLKDASDLLFK
ncbi:MAG: V-type ATP synthase subunit E family protein [Methanolinea sp.]|jgi:V/A-type H+-transporting ATPase subunit E|nr:V-type ATP synthase subunit E family protein [Methanolinea sp.]